MLTMPIGSWTPHQWRRRLEAEDMPTVRKIVRESGQQQYRFTALLQGIVESAPFQMRLKAVGMAQ